MAQSLIAPDPRPTTLPLDLSLQSERGDSLSLPSRPDQTGSRAVKHTSYEFLHYLAYALGNLTTSATYRCDVTCNGTILQCVYVFAGICM